MNILAQSSETLKAATDLKTLEDLRVKWLGKKGELTTILRCIGALPSVEEKKVWGSNINKIKEQLENGLAARREELSRADLERRLQMETIDVTLPGRTVPLGRRHLITQVLADITQVFLGLGFSVVDGPEVESEYYNFEALNIPADHPSREMWDSFYLGGDLLLRSHTSPVQMRVMERQPPPTRVIVPGKCYRRDAVDATHAWMFHQVEGLLVDQDVTFADLKGVLAVFARAVFGQARRTRFTPSYFPFTEPSAEMSVDCFFCNGAGCRVCKQSGWIEILGCGMVHPRVLEAACRARGDDAYAPHRVRGFAFGMGVERIAMLKYGVEDIRLFTDGDVRLLAQF